MVVKNVAVCLKEFKAWTNAGILKDFTGLMIWGPYGLCHDEMSQPTFFTNRVELHRIISSSTFGVGRFLVSQPAA